MCQEEGCEEDLPDFFPGSSITDLEEKSTKAVSFSFLLCEPEMARKEGQGQAHHFSMEGSWEEDAQEIKKEEEPETNIRCHSQGEGGFAEDCQKKLCCKRSAKTGAIGPPWDPQGVKAEESCADHLEDHWSDAVSRHTPGGAWLSQVCNHLRFQARRSEGVTSGTD
ncbi:hypothetical protein NDU88_002973 [Pleurodeles waltl]|uniref:Uncharacterized protein n=1 Tax=Pleurodeles waltl TaxID=8319 RepID=A0AAV7WTZ5_PLEWA|nr:hypothetical protein NDU88_002973 [Pleurodeles waltl]